MTGWEGHAKYHFVKNKRHMPSFPYPDFQPVLIEPPVCGEGEKTAQVQVVSTALKLYLTEMQKLCIQQFKTKTQHVSVFQAAQAQQESNQNK